MEEVNIEFTPVQDENPTPAEMPKPDENPNPQQYPQAPNMPIDPPQNNIPLNNMPKISTKCPNCGFENIDGAQVCFKCGTKLEISQDPNNTPNFSNPQNNGSNFPNTQQPNTENNTPVIDENINECVINGVTYRKILATCPVCFSRGVCLPKTIWKHKDDNCSGHMYIGSDGTIICGKCGKKDFATNWGFECANHDKSKDFYITYNPSHSQNIGTQIGLSFVSQMANEFGTPWLKLFY